MADRPSLSRWLVLVVSASACVLDPAGTAPGETAGGGACGDGVIDSGEDCDDGNTAPGDGCSGACAVDNGYSCSGTPQRNVS